MIVVSNWIAEEIAVCNALLIREKKLYKKTRIQTRLDTLLEVQHLLSNEDTNNTSNTTVSLIDILQQKVVVR